MKKRSMGFIFLISFVFLILPIYAANENYQLIGKLGGGTYLFDTHSIKMTHNDEMNQDCVDVWIKVVYNDKDWIENHKSIMKKIGAWKEGYDDFSYRLIECLYTFDARLMSVKFIDCTWDDQQLNAYSLSPLEWQKIEKGSIEESVYKTIVEYAKEHLIR